MQRRVLMAAAALISFSACGADDVSAPDATSRSVEIQMVEFAFQATESITIEAGETIEFIVTNAGTIDHQMEVLTDASRRLGKTDRLSPGMRSSLVVTFDEPGVYSVICDIDDHRTRGQQADFTVVEAS
jgi:plastocyanin